MPTPTAENPMPDVKIKFQRPSGASGGIHLDLTRWKQKVKWGETVNFIPQAGSDPFDFEITWKDPYWPFTGARRSVYGNQSTTASLDALPNNGQADVQGYYLITFYFQDDRGKNCQATIDPDMEIGT